MSTAKVVSLSVRASQSAHLCFDVGGILGESSTELGATVAHLDFPAFQAILGSMPSVPGHPARLLYDFLQIQAFVKPFTLAALRAEGSKATLSQAVNARANAYYAKYANAPDIIARLTQDYSPSISGSKPNRLEILASFSQQQMEQLRDAYLQDGRTDVVKTTTSLLDSSTSGMGDDETIDFRAGPQTFNTPAVGTSFTTSGERQGHFQMGASYTTQRQAIATTDYGYRIPYLENFAQYERAQISLIDEQFSQFMYSQNLPYLAAIFHNELSSIDSDVFRLQIAYLNTILISPFAGTVTGIYKNPGDAVRAGEPVFRVENISEILLVATLVYRGPISIGSPVKVETTLFDLANPPTTIDGRVVAVRGQGDDSQWEVIMKCKNLDGSGKPIFPLGYHFDYDNTSIFIS